MRTQRLWYCRINEQETRKVRAERCPGPDWYELERDTAPGESVRIVDEKAEIVAAPAQPKPDPRRAVIAAALPDILLAVADGADLREEIAKRLVTQEVQRGER